MSYRLVRTWGIRRASDGFYLDDTTVHPWVWRDRPQWLIFLSRTSAERFLEEHPGLAARRRDGGVKLVEIS